MTFNVKPRFFHVAESVVVVGGGVFFALGCRGDDDPAFELLMRFAAAPGLEIRLPLCERFAERRNRPDPGQNRWVRRLKGPSAIKQRVALIVATPAR